MENSSHCPNCASDLPSCIPFRSLGSRVALYTFLTVAIICTVLGNLLVVLSIAYFKQLQSSTNCFVMSLAVADLLVGLVVMPYSMVRSVDSCWYFGSTFCELHSSLDVMLCSASILHLSCIAFDRYYAVCNPLLYALTMSRSRVALLLIACWIVSFLISVVPIMLGLHKTRDKLHPKNDTCYFMVNEMYAVSASLVSFYLPMVTMAVAYWKIYKVARRQALRIKALQDQVTMQSEYRVKSQKHKKRGYMRREKKAAKTLGIIMGIFLLFWLPFFTANVIDPFINYRTTALMWEVFLWLGYVNSSLNPFLYGYLNRSFRRAFFIIMGCRICLSTPTANIDLSRIIRKRQTEK